MRSFGAFADACARRAAETSIDLVVGGVEADVVARHVVEDDEVERASRRASGACARGPASPSSAPKPTSTAPFFGLAERRAGRPRSARSRELPGLRRTSAACPRSARARSPRPRRPSGRRPRPARAFASRARSAAVGVSTTSTPGRRRDGEVRRQQRHLAPRGGGPPRRARRPSAPTSGCRRSAPRRAARASRRR